MAPFVDIAQMDKTVKNKIEYARTISINVSSSPEWPMMYPTRRKSIALNIERQTGVNTPENVLSDLIGASVCSKCIESLGENGVDAWAPLSP